MRTWGTRDKTIWYTIARVVRAARITNQNQRNTKIFSLNTFNLRTQMASCSWVLPVGLNFPNEQLVTVGNNLVIGSTLSPEAESSRERTTASP